MTSLGAGPPLVALHGATSLGREDFAAQLPGMSKAFLVHLPDARGHGRTRWDAARRLRVRWLVDDLVAFVDALGLDSFHLLGFSMGAHDGAPVRRAVPGAAADARRRSGSPRSASRGRASGGG